MKYRIIASDLDGTLLNSHNEISRKNLFAIAELSNRGVYFVPSTGRTFSEIPSELRENPEIRYFIYSNGAVILDRISGKRLTNCISDSDVQFILDALAPCSYHLTVRKNGNCFVDSAFQAEDCWNYYNLCEAHRNVVRDYAIYSPDLKTHCKSTDDIEVISVFFHDYNDKIACSAKLKSNERLRVAEADEYNLEIMSASAGKGNALCDLAHLLDVDIAETAAIGDSDNDSSIIQAAGLGLAVSNAADSLKAVADVIICSNDEHVVDYILAHF